MADQPKPPDESVPAPEAEGSAPPEPANAANAVPKVRPRPQIPTVMPPPPELPAPVPPGAISPDVGVPEAGSPSTEGTIGEQLEQVIRGLQRKTAAEDQVRREVSEALRRLAPVTGWAAMVEFATSQLVPKLDAAGHFRLAGELRALLQTAPDKDVAVFAVLNHLGVALFLGIEVTRDGLRHVAEDPSHEEAVGRLFTSRNEVLPCAGLGGEAERWGRLVSCFMNVLYAGCVQGGLSHDTPGKMRLAVIQRLLLEVLGGERGRPTCVADLPWWWRGAMDGAGAAWQVARSDQPLLAATARALGVSPGWR